MRIFVSSGDPNIRYPVDLFEQRIKHSPKRLQHRKHAEMVYVDNSALSAAVVSDWKDKQRHSPRLTVSRALGLSLLMEPPAVNELPMATEVPTKGTELSAPPCLRPRTL